MSESTPPRAPDGKRTAPSTPRRRDRRKGDRRAPVTRVAAVGDIHCGDDDVGAYRALFSRVNEEADVLLLAGDLTRRGTPGEMRIMVGELADVTIPIVAVLGNHDHESDQVDEACAILRERGIHLLDGDVFELNEMVGIAGIKGFMGGFGRRTLTAFGEGATKSFVGTALQEVQKLEVALRKLSAPHKVVLMHYAPTVETVIGEPEQIYPFLGNDRLAEPLDRYGASVAFHGHAHIGAFRGETLGGVPVFNVSHDLMKRDGIAELYYLHEIRHTAETADEAGEQLDEAMAGSAGGTGSITED
jgi:Icc-related predicted phosphoesterase